MNVSFCTTEFCTTCPGVAMCATIIWKNLINGIAQFRFTKGQMDDLIKGEIRTSR